ncbi:glutamate--tRNA ligase family protein [Sphingomonas sp. LR61]
MKQGTFPDFVVVRPNGKPLYTFTNPVDDALMGITHVLRGEDLLSSTPRQIALYEALYEIGLRTGDPGVRSPAVRHGRGQQEALEARPRGEPVPPPRRRHDPRGARQLPGPAGVVDRRRPRRLLDRRDGGEFDVTDVNPNPARFDHKKAEAINGDHIRLLEPSDFRSRLLPYLTDLVADPPTAEQTEVLDEGGATRPGAHAAAR